MVLRIMLSRHCGGAVTPIIYIYGAFEKVDMRPDEFG